jgi:hypothetical protein
MSLALVACSNATTEPTVTPDEKVTSEPTVETTVLKLGTGSFTTISNKSDATEDANSDGKITTTICAVVLDGDVIEQVTFDVVQVKTLADAKGVIASDFEGVLLSKKELGDDYGMVTYGDSISEWYQEVADLEIFLTGKTIEEALSLEANSNVLTELNTTTTISITDFIKALDIAVNTVENINGAYSFGLGTSTEFGLGHSSDASEDADGGIEVNVTYAIVAYDMDGNIVDITLDVAQNKNIFDTAGKFTTDTTVATPTKSEKGDDYGMLAYGDSISEWYQEVADLELFLIGKTAEETLVLEDNQDMMTELNTTTTIGISNFVKAIYDSTNDIKIIK